MNINIKSLNIKNPEVHELARELADLTGESMSAAVTEAVRERLGRLRREQGHGGRMKRLMALIDDCAIRLNAPGEKMMEVADLYDEETGLPK